MYRTYSYSGSGDIPGCLDYMICLKQSIAEVSMLGSFTSQLITAGSPFVEFTWHCAMCRCVNCAFLRQGNFPATDNCVSVDSLGESATVHVKCFCGQQVEFRHHAIDMMIAHAKAVREKVEQQRRERAEAERRAKTEYTDMLEAYMLEHGKETEDFADWLWETDQEKYKEFMDFDLVPDRYDEGFYDYDYD
jgi:hypothetical protein